MAAFEAEAEEQAMEAEALESIFMADFEQVSVQPFHWRIHLTPHPPGDDEENHVEIFFEAKVPAAYPNEKPVMSITPEKGLTEGQVLELQELADATAEENLGMAMIYTIAEELREWLLARNEPPADNSMHAAMLRRMQEKDAEKGQAAAGSQATAGVEDELQAEEERNRMKVLEGTPVTPDTFAAWKAKFDAERAPEIQAVAPEKQSGRDYFKSHSLPSDWEEAIAAEEGQDGRGAEDPPSDAPGAPLPPAVDVDAGLFADDLSDLDSLDDEEEEEEEDDEEGEEFRQGTPGAVATSR